jgi:uronate dehydrogenase
MRIFSCAQATNARSIGTWLSYDDLIHLVERSIDSPVVGFTKVWGLSNNDRAVVDNSKAGHLGYRPKDNAEQFAKDVFAKTPPLDNKDLANLCIGGPFATVELGNSGVAALGVVNDKKTT